MIIISSWLTDDWQARKTWCASSGEVDVNSIFSLTNGTSDFLVSPILQETQFSVAECSSFAYGSQQVRSIALGDFVEYWNSKRQESLYLKDWHLAKHATEVFYTCPEYFSSDWLNEFWDFRPDIDDDFRFVYLGPKGSWTPFHVDVYGSFSWSANVVGEKRWVFFPPGAEASLRDADGNLPTDVNKVNLDSSTHFIVHQKAGETVFVPSGWYHQVENLTDCVSINHNWANACNIREVYKHLKSELAGVRDSLTDLLDSPHYDRSCQNCLRLLAGMNFTELAVLLKYILITRWPNVQKDQIKAETLAVVPSRVYEPETDDPLNAKFYKMQMQIDVVLQRLNENCSLNMAQLLTAQENWLKRHELEQASAVLCEVNRDGFDISYFPQIMSC